MASSGAILASTGHLFPYDDGVVLQLNAAMPCPALRLSNGPEPLTIQLTNGESSVAREQRKLAAIVAADVVGYRLMGRKESGTLARFRSATEQQKPKADRVRGVCCWE